MENTTKLPEPILMQNQDGPFNCDSFMERNIIEFKKAFNIKHAIELGTCLGYSAEWFAKNFDKVDTIEISQEYLNIALNNQLNRLANIEAHLGSSVNILPHVLCDIDKNETVLIFIDSHFGNNWPILQELRIIKEAGLKPVLVIHDFYIPEHKDVLGYDSFQGVPLSLEFIEDALKEIYDGNFSVQYNTPEMAEGAKRGVAYVTPTIEEPVTDEVIEEKLPNEVVSQVIDWSAVQPGFVFWLNTGEKMTVKGIHKLEDGFGLVLVDSVGELLTCTNKEIEGSIGI